eukprot:5289943-Amphidinium_carterae.1
MKTVLSASPTLVVVRLGPTATKLSPWCITPTLWTLLWYTQGLNAPCLRPFCVRVSFMVRSKL